MRGVPSKNALLPTESTNCLINQILWDMAAMSSCRATGATNTAQESRVFIYIYILPNHSKSRSREIERE